MYIVPLPWRPNKHLLPTNIFIASRRLKQLQRRCMSNVSFGKAYKTKIKELIKLDFVKKVTEDTEVGDTQHHLAHSGVIKEGSTATLRITYGWFMQTEGKKFSFYCLKIASSFLVYFP